MSGFRPRFFVSDPGRGDLQGVELILDAEDSHHALRVLRLLPGDQCEVVVGAAVYAATVSTAADPVRVMLATPLEGDEAGASYRISVGLVQALGRPAAMEYVLEKGTEVGAGFFYFVRTAGSPPGRPDAPDERLARWRRIVREAAKQSKQVALPEVAAPVRFDELVDRLEGAGVFSVVLDPGAGEGLQRVLARAADVGALVSRVTKNGQSCRPVALWVGPEGGWTSAEAGRFATAGLTAARLGRSVLRTETAGPVAVAVARLALGDW